MNSWKEVVPDIILCSVYVYLLLRIATASEEYFKTPFYIFFTAAGAYSATAIVAYHITRSLTTAQQNWEFPLYKILMGINAFSTSGATFGKAVIAFHRYFVLKRRDFTEQEWSSSTIRRVLLAQFVYSLLQTASIWPAPYIYKNINGVDIIFGVTREFKMIQKALAVANYLVYIMCDIVFTFLTCRELHRVRQLIEFSTSTSHLIIVQQRNLFIIVTICSLTHLVLAAQQSLIFALTSLDLLELSKAVNNYYPLFNGLATYATPLCLVLLTPRLRERLLFRMGKIPSLVSPMSDKT